jgi:hypothetical protein
LRRPFLSRSIAVVLTLGALILGTLAFAGATTAATTIATTTTCSNGLDNSGGLGVICQVTVVNRITASGGSAQVTVRECHGAAGDPQASCATRVSNLTRPVTHVTQCNASTNGGGGTLRCSVTVRNNFVGFATGATPVTVNQCVGSGDGIANNCDPFPATTTGAAITQCDGSANGGTLVRLQCTASGGMPSSHGVTINQCNGSGNGGGSLVICSATITNRRIAAPATGGTTPTTGGTPSAPPTDVVATSDGPATPSGSNQNPLLFLAIFVVAALAIGRKRWSTDPR